MDNQRLTTLRNQIDRAAQCYYYGSPVLTDAQFDALLKELKQIAPGDPRHSRVGHPVPPDTMLIRYKHTVPSYSLAKCDNVAEFDKWYEKRKGALMVQLKADGCTVFLYYNDAGLLDRAVTRGGDDGHGEDVTANAIRAMGVPRSIGSPRGCVVRGEMLLDLENWRKVDPDEESNPRNLGTGMLRRTEGSGAEYLRFFAFGFDNQTFEGAMSEYEPATEDEKLEFLTSLGFDIIPHQLCKSVADAKKFYDKTAKDRDKLPFWIDGVVFKLNDLEHQKKLGVSSGRPNGQTVLKFEAPGAETVVVGLTVTVGHTGAIIPTADLKPVRIGGANIDSALLNNYEMIQELDLAIGDTVRVIKAKDIIPQIESVTKRPADRKPIKAPTKCPACGGEVGKRQLVAKVKDSGGAVHEMTYGRALECKNPDCCGKVIAKVKSWINKLDMKGIGDGVLAGIVNELGVKAPAGLYRLTAEKLAALQIGNGKFGTKRAEAVMDEIDAKRKLPLHMFLGSLGVPHLGRRRVQLVMKAVPGEMDKLANWRSGKLLTVADRANIPNIGIEINDGIAAFSNVIDDLLTCVTVEDNGVSTAKPAATGGALSGRNYCFTGKIEKVGTDGKRYTRDKMQQLVIDNGGSVSDDVRSGVTHLVQADPDSKSSKSEKAKKLGVEMVSEADFFASVGL